MPILQNIGGRFQWTQPCFGFISKLTAAKILTIVDFTWSALGFFSTFLYGLYWYDLTDIQDVLKKDTLHHEYTPALRLVRSGSELYYYQPMHVSGLMALLLGFSSTTCLAYALFLRLQTGTTVCAPHRLWLCVFCLSLAIRPFAFLLLISLLDPDYTEILFTVAATVSLFYSLYGVWIIVSCKTKALPPRPLITYEGLN